MSAEKERSAGLNRKTCIPFCVPDSELLFVCYQILICCKRCGQNWFMVSRLKVQAHQAVPGWPCCLATMSLYLASRSRRDLRALRGMTPFRFFPCFGCLFILEAVDGADRDCAEVEADSEDIRCANGFSGTCGGPLCAGFSADVVFFC